MDPQQANEPEDGVPTAGGLAAFKTRERDEDRKTRKPLTLWDRLKFVTLILGAWFVFVLAAMGDNPILPFRDSFNEQVRAKWWLLALAALEVLRQVHYAISEHSAAYHGFWTRRFAAAEERTGKFDDWTRFRIARFLKFAFVLVVVDLILARALNTSPALALVQLPITLFRALPLIFQLLFGVFFVIIEFGALFWFLSRGGTEIYYPDDIKTRFSDVWGQDAVLERIKENLVFLEDPESIERRGGYVPGGILLWGPPGTGKTLMAEAVAGETGRPYVFVDPGAFINMFMGVGVLKVKSLFRKLRRLAVRYGGVIVFFDEADSLGARSLTADGGPFGQMTRFAPELARCNGLSYLSESGARSVIESVFQSSGEPEPGAKVHRVMPMGMGGGGGGMGTLQALLSELSGLKKPRGFMNRVVRRLLGLRPKPPPKYRMLVMMATNLPQALDEALLRPGRIDRIYKVGYPSKAGRVKTYEGYLAKVAHELTAEDVDKLATITPYATGASIKDMVNEALVQAIGDGRDTITWADMIKAKHTKDLGPPQDIEYIERERHAVAVHEACHAVAAYRVRHHATIDIATIEPGGTYLGMVRRIPAEERFTQWRSEFEADVMVSLASLVGEKMFFDGDNSSGVSGDLDGATQIATLMEGYWGMGQTIASHGVTLKVGIGGSGPKGKEEKSDKELLDGSLGRRIEAKLEQVRDKTEQLLLANRTQILALAHALETYKTLAGEDVHAVIEGRRGPIVDGTPYGTAEFAQIAEEYHALVVAAHKSNGQVGAPLPLLNGQRSGVGVAASLAFEDLGDPNTPVELTAEELAGRQFAPDAGNGGAPAPEVPEEPEASESPES